MSYYCYVIGSSWAYVFAITSSDKLPSASSLRAFYSFLKFLKSPLNYQAHYHAQLNLDSASHILRNHSAQTKSSLFFENIEPFIKPWLGTRQDCGSVPAITQKNPKTLTYHMNLARSLYPICILLSWLKKARRSQTSVSQQVRTGDSRLDIFKLRTRHYGSVQSLSADLFSAMTLTPE